jgi:hypothetical protein
MAIDRDPFLPVDLPLIPTLVCISDLTGRRLASEVEAVNDTYSETYRKFSNLRPHLARRKAYRRCLRKHAPRIIDGWQWAPNKHTERVRLQGTTGYAADLAMRERIQKANARAQKRCGQTVRTEVRTGYHMDLGSIKRRREHMDRDTTTPSSSVTIIHTDTESDGGTGAEALAGREAICVGDKRPLQADVPSDASTAPYDSDSGMSQGDCPFACQARRPRSFQEVQAQVSCAKPQCARRRDFPNGNDDDSSNINCPVVCTEPWQADATPVISKLLRGEHCTDRDLRQLGEARLRARRDFARERDSTDKATDKGRELAGAIERVFREQESELVFREVAPRQTPCGMPQEKVHQVAGAPAWVQSGLPDRRGLEAAERSRGETVTQDLPTTASPAEWVVHWQMERGLRDQHGEDAGMDARDFRNQFRRDFCEDGEKDRAWSVTANETFYRDYLQGRGVFRRPTGDEAGVRSRTRSYFWRKEKPKGEAVRDKAVEAEESGGDKAADKALQGKRA